MNTQKITLGGGFHNVADINLRVKNNALSIGQYKRLDKHMCSVKNCVCGWRGFELSGIDRAAFRDMLDDAERRESMSKW